MTMRSTGEHAMFHGKEYAVVSRGRDDSGEYVVGLLLDAADGDDFDRVTTLASGDRMATVRRDDLDRYERVVTTGTVDGVEVTLLSVGDPAECYVLHARDFAERRGFAGDPYDGWSGPVPRGEITDVRESVTDLLHTAGSGGGR
jgi:hypothetical protein